MFYDRVTLHLRAGAGGRGSLSFRREKYVPRGGPDGGDGGRGGSIWFEASHDHNSLIAFRGRRHIRAEKGGDGAGKTSHGRDAEDVLLLVPAGTTISNAETGEVIADLVHPGDRCQAAPGGRGGRGNSHFTSALKQAPRLAERGEPGVEVSVLLELKTIADAGLLGFPNAGKSTFLTAISAARPRIASYPFTTLEPHLGVAETSRGERVAVADLPGLIEGASQGAGLGLDFLRHLERTGVLVHLLDGSAGDPVLVAERYRAIRNEIKAYGHGLERKPEVLVLNKADLPGVEDLATPVSRLLRRQVLVISAQTGEGCPQVVDRVVRALRQVKKAPVIATQPEVPVLRPLPRGQVEFRVVKLGDSYQLFGAKLEKLLAMTDIENEEALRRFQKTLERWKVKEALEEAGARDGDTVILGEEEFTFEP